MKHVALLRGINVGGNNKLPMKELCALFAAAGCAEVSSYIQSGNVIFAAPAKTVAGLARTVEAAIERRFAFRPPIQLRTAGELAAVVDGLPFDDPRSGFDAAARPGKAGACDPAPVFVGFLAAAPTKAQLAGLDPALGAPDRYVVRGRHVYMEIVGSAARTKLTVGYFDRKLATVTTMRNWNTVVKLRELTGARE